METTTDEHVIGGFLSNSLIYKTKKSCALFVTNKRLFVLESPRSPVLPFSAFVFGWIVGSFFTNIFLGLIFAICLAIFVYILLGALTPLGDIMPEKTLTPTYELKVLRELEKRKEISIPKESITAIELTPPSSQVLGSLKITTNTGNSIQLTMSSSNEFEKLKTILKAYSPE